MPTHVPKRALITLLAGAGLLLSSACAGEGVKFGGTPVTEPAKFLEQTERQWAQDIGSKRVNKHSEARCYFGRVEQATDVEPRVFCGPIRYYNESESGSGGVWDIYPFYSSGAGDSGQTTLILGEADEPGDSTPDAERSEDLPAGLLLVRPDGKTPPTDADSLAAPPPPSAKPGFIDVVDDVDLQKPVKPESSSIITPKQTFKIDRVGTTGRVKTESGLRTPAKGETFFVMQMLLEDGPFSEAYDDHYGDDYVPVENTLAVKVGEELRKLPWKDDNGGGMFSGSDDDEKVVIVVSAPASIAPELVIDSAGTDQTASFKTGERTSRTAAAFYETKPTELASQYVAPKVKLGESSELQHSVVFERASLTPFDPVLGWAPKGRAWLSIETKPDDEHDLYGYGLSGNRSKTIATDSKGTVSKDMTKFDDDDTPGEVEGLIFPVDPAERSFTVKYQLTYTFTDDAPEGAPRGFTTKPKTFTVKFSG